MIAIVAQDKDRMCTFFVVVYVRERDEKSFTSLCVIKKKTLHIR